MRIYGKWILAVVMLVGLYACGQKSETIFLEKDGTLYEVADQVSFYYPKNFQMDTTAENKEIVRFVKEEEVITYATTQDDTDNKVEDMPELYAGQLEEEGASEVGYKNLKIESGLECQEFTGVYKSTGIHFKHLVYFTTEATYAVTYQAPKKLYNDQITIISQYLSSLTVHHE